MSIKEKVQKNPLTSIAVSITAIAVGVTTGWAGIGVIDQLHTTEYELVEYDKTSHSVADREFGVLEDRLDVAELVNKCRWLSDRVDRLRYEIYILERDNASPDFIQSKRTDLINEEREFNALRCAAMLS